jgi:molybdenum cofactor synthesis domain-containing protein
MSRKEFRDLAPPETAHETIASLPLDPGTETVPLAEARGRVLAERVDADLDVPGFDRASVDGYAVRAADTFGADEADPARLTVVGTVHAGVEPEVEVGDGEAAEISTGAVVPDGADAVVMVERTDLASRSDADRSSGERSEPRDTDGEDVLVRTSVAPGDRIMFAGADVAAGERALDPGTELTAREVGLLSALGVDRVPVRGRPTVGVISTGDELVRPGEPVNSDAGQIYDVNSYSTAAAVEAAGGDPRLYPHAGDDYDAMERVLREAADECDLVLSSGSTSASAVDVIYDVVEERGELLLHGVAVKPGKPMIVGTLGGSAYVGLPGYPVSALSIFRTFVAPAIREAAGLPEPGTATVDGEMAVRERYAEGRLRLMPVGLVEGGPSETTREAGGDPADADRTTLVYPVDKGSGATTSIVEADGVVEMHPDTEYLDVGERVTVRLFSPDVRPPTLLGAGEDDPALSRLLDRLERPRYLGMGSRPGVRQLRDGVPDVAVTSAGDAGVDHVELGAWTREWGLVVPAGNPDDVSGLGDLVERDLAFVNRTTDSGLRTSLTDALGDHADERRVDRPELESAIEGFDRAVRAHESPARRVLAGDGDVGLGLRATAERLEAAFVPVGRETVRVLANPDRVEKPGVQRFRDVLADAEDVFEGLPGFGR